MARADSCQLARFVCAQHADVAVNKILIGNKCDMDEDREVTRRTAPRLLKYGHAVFGAIKSKETRADARLSYAPQHRSLARTRAS